jgi:hypothetical protein
MNLHSALRIPHSTLRWLPDMDLNHDKQIQSLLCYRYTIGQTRTPKIGISRGESRQASKPDVWIFGLMGGYCLSAERRLHSPRINPLIQPSIKPTIHPA